MLSEADDKFTAESVLVLSEVRRVVRALEADRRVSMSRMFRVFRELYDTLSTLAADRNLCGSVTQSVRVMRSTEPDDNKSCAESKKDSVTR